MKKLAATLAAALTASGIAGIQENDMESRIKNAFQSTCPYLTLITDVTEAVPEEKRNLTEMIFSQFEEVIERKVIDWSRDVADLQDRGRMASLGTRGAPGPVGGEDLWPLSDYPPDEIRYRLRKRKEKLRRKGVLL